MQSYTRLNYEAAECHCAMAASHTANNSELESHPAHRGITLTLPGKKKSFIRVGCGLRI